jgi:hypothetical protein
MTKSDYKQWVEKNFTFLAISDAYSLIDYIFKNGFEDQNKLCDGCCNKPEEGKNYPMICGDCKRFYSDQYGLYAGAHE